MKTMKKYKLPHTGAIVLLFLLYTACQDRFWDEHYTSDESFNGMSLMEVIENKSDLSEFASILKATGMDSVLNSSQPFTVWAPTNSALAGYTSNETVTERLLRNHIARYVYNSADLTDKNMIRVRMLNGKYQDYYKTGEGYFFGVAAVGKQVYVASNGILQTIDTQAPYNYNIYQMAMSLPETDSISTYWNFFYEKIFRPGESTPLYQNEEGKIVYDSVFYERNLCLNHWGRLDLEDSVYTVILPNNEAWIDAYDRIAPYYKTVGSLLSETGTGTSLTRTFETGGALADSLGRQHTSQTIAGDLVFRGKLNILPSDSLISTGGNIFHHPEYLFAQASRRDASNGYVYLADKLMHDALSSWHKPIRIEAESSVGRTFANAALSTRNLEQNTRENLYLDSVSNRQFLEVRNLTNQSLTQPYVTYDIPNTLSARYNIYCVFAPKEAWDSETPDSTKVQFYLTYVNENGIMREGSAITSDPETGQAFVTKSKGITRFLVARDFVFPFANYVSSPFAMENKQINSVKLRIRTNVANNETTIYSKIMRIDYLILEPVNE
jgi:hypothetical protein